MRRYRNKQPRGPLPPSGTKDDFYSMVIGMIIILAALRLGIACASPTAVAAVGDRLQFGPASPRPAGIATVLQARKLSGPFAPPGDFCNLDVNAMTLSQGALSVIAVRQDGVMLSWAGGLTAKKANFGANDTQILISANDYESLTKPQFLKH